jgi:hypothetical protein
VSSLRINGAMSLLPIYAFMARKRTLLPCMYIFNTLPLIHDEHCLFMLIRLSDVGLSQITYNVHVLGGLYAFLPPKRIYLVLSMNVEDYDVSKLTSRFKIVSVYTVTKELFLGKCCINTMAWR